MTLFSKQESPEEAGITRFIRVLSASPGCLSEQSLAGTCLRGRDETPMT
ncbi:MAG TPA: hypothetical protein VHD63_05045 [Ktedonobacteraceae bacterium]|nr:hypothetical protein [Ktedonobacteraceae bacterium]